MENIIMFAKAMNIANRVENVVTPKSVTRRGRDDEYYKI